MQKNMSSSYSGGNKNYSQSSRIESDSVDEDKSINTRDSNCNQAF